MYLALIYGGKVSLLIFTVILYYTRCVGLLLGCLYFQRKRRKIPH